MSGRDQAKRARAGPSEHDRARALSVVRRCGADGLLSSGETDDAVEQIFRARTLGELDAVLSRLPQSPHIAAETILSHGIVPPVSKAPAPWWRGMLLWSVGGNILWLVVWLITGGAVVWLFGGVILSLIAFTFRFVLGHRRQVRPAPSRRGRAS